MLLSGYPLHRENGEKKVCHGKQGILKFCQKKFLVLKKKDNCRENFEFCFYLERSAKSVTFVYVMVTNYVNLHRKKLWSDMENTGNL